MIRERPAPGPERVDGRYYHKLTGEQYSCLWVKDWHGWCFSGWALARLFDPASSPHPNFQVPEGHPWIAEFELIEPALGV